MPAEPTARRLELPEGLAGERLDVALSRLLGISRTRVADLVDQGLVLREGTTVNKADTVRAGDVVDVALPTEPTPVAPATIVPGMTVCYDDDDVVVVDKPVGVAAHPSPGWTGPTVVGGLAATGYRIATSGAAERQGVVHRLDVGTSGLMVVAKSETAYRVLKQAFRDREVEKVYHALVQGHPDPTAGTIDAPVGRHPRHDWRWAVTAEGKPSVTHYTTLEAFPAASLLEVTLETGRTHQIRVHLSALRHPCVGDLAYGADPVLSERLGLNRQWLHAVRLGFAHPTTGEQLVVSSPHPADLQHALHVLRQGPEELTGTAARD